MQAEAAKPTDAPERHHILDALRGWALAGVLMANMVPFIGFGMASEPERAAAIGSRWDDLSELLIEWLWWASSTRSFRCCSGSASRCSWRGCSSAERACRATCGDWRRCS
jgi:hypothetical protein